QLRACECLHVARRRGGAADLGHDVRGELGLARGRIDDDHGALGDRLVLAERRLDLAELDAEPAELDLTVTSASELERTVASPPADVARPIQAATVERVVHETFGGQLGPAVVAACDLHAPDADLSPDADRHRSEPSV